MELLAFFRTLRRRWLLIVALTLVGGAIGVASTELNGTAAVAKKTGTDYKATNTLVVDLSSQNGQGPLAFQGLSQVAIYTTTGAVPDLVAKKLGTTETGRELAQQITTTTNSATNTIDITAVDTDPAKATELSNAFATTLVQTLDQRALDVYGQTRDQLTGRLDTLQSQEDQLLPQIGAVPRPADYDNLKAQYDALVNQYSITYASYAELGAQGPPTTRFSTLQTAEAIPISHDEYESRLNLGATGANNLDASAGTTTAVATGSGSSSSFQGPVSRGVLGALLGFLAGIGLAMMLDRLDRRIRTRAQAEEAFGLPVLAEVPVLKRSEQKDRRIVTETSPLSRTAEAYRAIRSSLLFSRAAIAGDGTVVSVRNGEGAGGSLFEPEVGEPFVVMVTSGAPGEGKTTTSANLAVVFAEAGSSVLVMNCDFRRPMLHRYFGIEDEPRRVHDTRIAGVKVVTNVLSDPAANPAQVVAAQRQAIAAARGRFDVILLDTAPLLTANDAIELVASADLILLVARVGSTNTESGQRTAELLNRLEVPLGGVVLVGAQAASSDYYYYYQPGRVEGNAKVSRRDAATGTEVKWANPEGNGNGHGNGSVPDDMFAPEPAPSAPADPPPAAAN